MNILISVLIGFISWFFGLLAFSQIIGCIRTLSHFFALALWSVIVIVISLLVYNFLYDYIIAYVIGLAISFVKVLFTPNIE